MIWLEHDKDELERLFKTLPRHNSDHAELTRYPTIYKVSNGGDRAVVKSGLQIYRTELDGGATGLYAVGHIEDTVSLSGDEPKLVDRHIRLQTRMLGIGHHIPM
jgi:methanesulfonate monooxygenase small subunit